MEIHNKLLKLLHGGHYVISEKGVVYGNKKRKEGNYLTIIVYATCLAASAALLITCTLALANMEVNAASLFSTLYVLAT